MKLTFIANKITGRGGTETVLVKVLNNLVENGNDIRLVLSNMTPDKEWLHKLNSSVKVIYPKNSSRLNRLVYFIKIFFTSPQNTNYIILSPNIIKLFANLRKMIHKDCKLISWFHFSIANQNNYNPKNIIYADYHLAISSAIKKQMVDLGISSKRIFLIYNPAIHHTLLIGRKHDNKKHLLYVGRVQEYGQKNLHELLQAFSLVDSSIFLDIYGDGKDKKNCQQLCYQLGINKRVVWHGWVDDVWDELNFHPFAIILTSKFEGLPMVFLEALSRGIPCISANFDGYDDIIDKNNGTYYQLGNIKQCAEKVQEVAKRQYNGKVVQNSISKFYGDKYFNNLNRVLQTIINYR